MRSRLLLPLLLLWFTLFLRLSQPQNQAIFADEGINLYWAQEFAQNHSQNYPVFMDGRFLFGVFMGSVGIFGPAPLYYGRLIIALCALLGSAASMGLGRRMGGWRTAALAGLIYALLPHALFHERQALTDPLMAAAGGVAIWAAVALAHPRPRQTPWLILAAGVGISAAFLFKPSGLVYALAPPLVWWMWPRTAVGAGKQAAVLATALLLTLGFLGLFRTRWGVDDGRLATQNLGLIHCPPIACQLDPAAQWRDLQDTLPPLPNFLATYYGWPLLALAVAAWPHGRRPARFLLTLATGFLLFFLLAGRYQLVPRYLLPLAVPLVALAAQGGAALFQFKWARPRWVVPLVLAGTFSHALLLVAHPTAALLAGFDRYQYVSGPVAGLPFQQAAQDILAETPAPLILTRHFMRYSLAAFLDPRHGQVQNPWEVTWAAVQTRLAQDGVVYVVDELPAPPATADPTSRFYPYQDGQSSIRVRPIRATDAHATAALYDFIYAPPAEIAADYAALAGQLDGWSTAVATYPPHQLSLLAPLLAPAVPTLPLGGAAPWDVAAVIESLATAAPARLTMLFLDETRLDPQRQVETWLAEHCFRAAEQWVGALRMVRYGCAPASTGPRWVLNLPFEQGIVLESVTVLDPAPRAGDMVRFQLVWRAEAAVARPYQRFVHLFDAAGIVAQQDGQPVGELRPTTSWTMGEIITDQLAIQLPMDAPPGIYQMRIGLYEALTQTRLPTAAGADFWVGGEVRLGE